MGNLRNSKQENHPPSSWRGNGVQWEFVGKKRVSRELLQTRRHLSSALHDVSRFSRVTRGEGVTGGKARGTTHVPGRQVTGRALV